MGEKFSIGSTTKHVLSDESTKWAGELCSKNRGIRHCCSSSSPESYMYPFHSNHFRKEKTNSHATFLSKSSWFWTRNIHKQKMLNPMPRSKNQEVRSRIPAWRPSPLSFTFDLLPPTPLTSWAMVRLGFLFPVVKRHGRFDLMKGIHKDDDIWHTILHTLTCMMVQFSSR